MGWSGVSGGRPILGWSGGLAGQGSGVFPTYPVVSGMLWVPKTCATWSDASRAAVGSVTRTVPGGQVWFGLACEFFPSRPGTCRYFSRKQPLQHGSATNPELSRHSSVSLFILIWEELGVWADQVRRVALVA